MDKLARAHVLRNLALDPRSRALPSATRARHVPAALDAVAVPPDLSIPGPAPAEAWEAAHRDGYAAGLEEGRAAGFEAGREAGFASGHDEAQAAGRKSGLEAGHAEGYEAGREAGIAAGREAAEEAVRESHRAALERLEAIVHSAERDVARRVEQSEDDVVELVFAAVCRIVGELAVTRAGVRGMVRHAIAELSEGPLVAVRLHEQDLALLRGEADFPSALERPGGPKGVQWIADERIELGGCRLEAMDGTLDVALETQLARLRDALLETRRARRRLEGGAC
jgi:flagellar assembly protein FliH